MHEATIASHILDIVSVRLANYPESTAQSVTVLVGSFRNVDDDCLQFAFDALKADRSGCEACQLRISKSEVRARCNENDHIYTPREDDFYRCNCGSGMGEILQGEELDVIECLFKSKQEESLCTK
jgi:hydrogenase nickel insertion protein HypA